MTDDQVPPAQPPRRRFLRRSSLGVGAFVLIVLVVTPYFVLPWIARPVLERVLSAALNTPVSIGQLSWAPFEGRVNAGHVSVGGGSDRIAVERLVVEVRLRNLWRGERALDRIEIDAPTGTVQLDAQYRPTLGTFGSAGTGASTPPAITVRQLVVTEGELTVRYPLQGQMRAAPLHITRLVSSDIKAAAGDIEMSAQLAGSLGGAPLEADAHLHLAGEHPQIEVNVAVTGLAVNRGTIDLPPGLETLRTTLDVKATYESKTPSQQALRLDIRLGEPRITGGAGTEFSAKAVALPDILVDFATSGIDLGAVTLDAPVLTVAFTPEGVVLPLRAEGSGASSVWTVESGNIEMHDGRLRGGRGESTVLLTVESGSWAGIARGRPTSLALRATADGGGSIAITGTLGIDPFEAALDVQLAQLQLAPVAQVAGMLPLHLASGTGDGTFRVTHRDGRMRLQGKGRVRDLRTAPPNPTRPAEVMAVDAAEADLAIDTGASPGIDIASLKLSYPYVLVQRRRDGTFPSTLFMGETGEVPAADDTATAAGTRAHIGQIEVDGGKVEFIDTTLEPAYWTSLSNFSAHATDILFPAATVGSFTIAGKQDELSPVDVSGAFTGGRLNGRAALKDVVLEPLNPYVSPLLGYDLTSGRLSVNATAASAPPLLAATVEMVLRGVDVRQTGVDVIQNQSGVPLPIALSLIANALGEIEMTLPLTMDTTSGRLALGSIVGQALRNAIVGALTSPLRILGSLFGTAGAPFAFAIDPIPFEVGSGSLKQAGAARLAQIARILQTHKGLVLVAMPQITAADLREVGDDRAQGLANQRSAAVRDALVGSDASPRLAPERLMLVAWTPPTGPPPTGQSGIYVELQEQP
jgi:hypothetical protein